MSRTLGEIAEHINAELSGDSDCVISSVGTLQNATVRQLSFLSNRRYSPLLKNTRAGAVVLSAHDKDVCPVASLVVEDPYLAYVQAVRLLHPETTFNAGCHESAVIEPSAKIAETACIGANVSIGANVTVRDHVYIGSGCVLESDVTVGEGSYLVANVTLCHEVKIGARVRLHPGVVIGADGFGIANDKGKWLKIPQLGSVAVGNDVEIGANTTVDRGTLEDTVIDDGVQIDNQVQIAHNVYIGEHTAIAGCSAIAGSAHIGKRCMIGGGTCIAGHLEIVDDVIITAMSGVANSIKEAGVYSSGIAISDNKTWRKNMTRFRHLDELARRVQQLEKKIDQNE